MADQLSGTFADDDTYSESEIEELDSEPENDKSAQQDSLIPSAAPPLPVSEEYQQAIDASIIEVDVDYFMSPENPNGLLSIFLAATSTPEYEDETLRKFAEITFVAMVKLLVSEKAARINRPADRETEPKDLPPIDSFEIFVKVASHHRYCPDLTLELFEHIHIFIIGLWNQAYNPDRERVLAGLEALDVALGGMFHEFCNPKAKELLPQIWNVINWWLEPPGSIYMFQPAPMIPHRARVGHLMFLEARLRASGHGLDAEKAAMVKKWLDR